jgi:hypothetical protein
MMVGPGSYPYRRTVLALFRVFLSSRNKLRFLLQDFLRHPCPIPARFHGRVTPCFRSAILLDFLTSILINSYPTFCFHPKSFCLGFPEGIQAKDVFEMRWADGSKMEFQPHFLQREWGFLFSRPSLQRR